MGMVGGGRGAFIGAVHRMAAAIDGEIDFVAFLDGLLPPFARALYPLGQKPRLARFCRRIVVSWALS